MTILTALPSAENPLDGVSPDLSVFGSALDGKLELLLGGIWALALVACAAGFLLGLARWGWAKKKSHDPDDLTGGSERMQKAGLAFGATAMAGVLLGAILNLAG